MRVTSFPTAISMSLSRSADPVRTFLRSILIVLLLYGALPAASAADLEILPEHPRLFFRETPWAGRLTVKEIRVRFGHTSARTVVERMRGTLPNLALKALILQDPAVRSQVIQELIGPLQFENPTTDEGVELAWRSMAFDWLFTDPMFSSSQRTEAGNQIAAGAEFLIRSLEDGGHVFHTRMYGWATGITLAGLALHGHHPAADRLARYGRDYYVQQLFPARQLQDGSVHNGFGYGRKYTMWLTAHFLSAWYSATGENLWARIESEQGDWARREMLFNIYGRYPDGTYLRFGDSYSLMSDGFTFRAVSERAAAYGDALGFGFLRFLMSDSRERGSRGESEGSQDNLDVVDEGTAYTYFLFYDPDAEIRSPWSLPTKILFSPEGTGMVIWRSTWEKDGTTLFFKCGDYFGDHGHFDQGHLDIFRRAPLLIDSGSYLTFSGTFRMDYWRKTVAHNSILITEPGRADEGGQRVFHSQEDPTIQSYLENKQSETGEILAYEVKERIAYVAGEFSAAYPADRAEKITRELAFVDDRFLLVRDRITVGRPGLSPRILWHCPVQPVFAQDGKGFSVSRKGARATVQVLLPRESPLDWIDGFQVAGQQIRPEGQLKGLDDMGVGRVEVMARENGPREFEFLHLIDIADSDVSEVPVSMEQDGETIRVKIGRSLVILAPDRSMPQLLGAED